MKKVEYETQCKSLQEGKGWFAWGYPKDESDGLKELDALIKTDPDREREFRLVRIETTETVIKEGK